MIIEDTNDKVTAISMAAIKNEITNRCSDCLNPVSKYTPSWSDLKTGVSIGGGMLGVGVLGAAATYYIGKKSPEGESEPGYNIVGK